MGLDQYAYVKTPESGEEGESPKFVWRKHSKLQIARAGFSTATSFRTSRPRNTATTISSSAHGRGPKSRRDRP